VSPLRFHEATTAEVERLARTLVAARTVADTAELDAIHAAAPWRLQVNDRGDVAVLDQWRDHLPYLSIEALWCPPKRVPNAVAHIRELGVRRGFADVVSPPTPVEEMHAYESAGMHAHTVVATYALERAPDRPRDPGSLGLTIRDVTAGDIPALLGVDAACFAPFWCYDARHLERFCTTARMRVAERDGVAVGYTLCTVIGDDGLLGRLCVAPPWRRKGVGSALLGDAVRSVWDRGIGRVVLSTQTDNVASQALYRQAHFRDTGRRYAFLHFGAERG